MQMLEDEDIPSDDSMSPAEDSPRRDYSRPLVKPQDTIVLDFGGGSPGNRSKCTRIVLGEITSRRGIVLSV